MADKKISALTGATTPLAGTEVLPIVQSGTTVKVSVANLTAGRPMSASSVNISGLTASTALALDASKEIVSVTNTGTGDNVLATSPTLVTPILGVASATSLNKVALTAPATNATLTIAEGKTLTVSNSLTIAGTDATTMTFPSTSATLARTDAVNSFTGDQTLSTGNLVIGTDGKGIDFTATPGAGTSELLDDYEEGNWTPSITGTTSNSGQVYALQTGRYTKIGRQVNVQFYIGFSTEGTFTGSFLQLSGLPFTISNDVPAISGGMLLFGGMGTVFTTIGLQLNQNSTTALLTAITAAATGTGHVGVTDLTDTTILTGQFTYFV